MSLRPLKFIHYVAYLVVCGALACGGGTSGSGLNTYEGNVRSESGTSIENAIITIESTGDSATTDKNGEYTLRSDASGESVSILAETAEFSGKGVVKNVLPEKSRVRVNIVLDSKNQRSAFTSENVQAEMVGVCTNYFRNGDVIQQVARVPRDTTCTVEVQVLADGKILEGSRVAVQAAGCSADHTWYTLETGITGNTDEAGIAKISFAWLSPERTCHYRIVAPFQSAQHAPLFYPFETWAE